MAYGGREYAIRKVKLREASSEIQLNTEFPGNQGKKRDTPK